MVSVGTGFHLFGKTKVNLRSLVIFNCHLKGADDEPRVEIKRIRIGQDGAYELEPSNVDYRVFKPGSTLHLHDVYLDKTFGLSISFAGSSKFEFGSKHAEAHPLLSFRSLDDEEVSVVAQIDAAEIA